METEQKEDLRDISMKTIELIRKINGDELANAYLLDLAKTDDEHIESLLKTLLLEANFQIDCM